MFRTNKIALLSLFFFLAQSIQAHDNHIGLIRIESINDSTLQIIIKIDTEDFNAIASKKNDVELIKEKIKFFSDKKLLTLTYIEKKQSEGYSWYTFQTCNKKRPFTILNTLLFDIFDDQKYVLIAQINSLSYQEIMDINTSVKTLALH